MRCREAVLTTACCSVSVWPSGPMLIRSSTTSTKGLISKPYKPLALCLAGGHMNWLAHLEKIEAALAGAPQNLEKVSSVGFVGTSRAPSSNPTGNAAARTSGGFQPLAAGAATGVGMTGVAIGARRRRFSSDCCPRRMPFLKHMRVQGAPWLLPIKSRQSTADRARPPHRA